MINLKGIMTIENRENKLEISFITSHVEFIFKAYPGSFNFVLMQPPKFEVSFEVGSVDLAVFIHHAG